MVDGTRSQTTAVSDGDLARAIAAAAPGEAQAAEAELYRRFAPRVRLFGLRRLRSEAGALDLAQDVLMRTIERLRAGEVRDPDAIASFVLGMSRKMAAATNRTARRRETLSDAIKPPLFADGGSQHELDLAAVERCLGELADRERAVIVQSFYAERTAADIGADLGLTSGAIRVARHRAIGKLRNCIGLDSGR